LTGRGVAAGRDRVQRDAVASADAHRPGGGVGDPHPGPAHGAQPVDVVERALPKDQLLLVGRARPARPPDGRDGADDRVLGSQEVRDLIGVALKVPSADVVELGGGDPPVRKGVGDHPVGAAARAGLQAGVPGTGPCKALGDGPVARRGQEERAGRTRRGQDEARGDHGQQEAGEPEQQERRPHPRRAGQLPPPVG